MRAVFVLVALLALVCPFSRSRGPRIFAAKSSPSRAVYCRA